MSNQKETHESIRQNGENVKNSQKYDANLRKNSSLYFQIGLIICLITAYGLLEMKFETNIPNEATLLLPTDVYMADVRVFTPEVVKEETPVTQKTSKPATDFEVVPDTAPNVFLDVPEKPTTPVSKPLKSGEIFLEKKPDDSPDVNFEAIEFVPIYPGCEKKKTNDDKRKCMSEKINQLIQKTFNTDLGSDLGLNGKQVIRTQFKIDKKGHVSNIQVRGPHPELEKEATRVINIIPEMTPGRQRDKNVGVIYTLPIVFEVQ